MLLLPLTSVTVRITVFGPATLAQVKLLLFSVVVAMPQASLLPLFTAEAVVLPFPALFNCTVTGWQSAIGAIKSWTVTVAEHVLLLPEASVAVKTTVLAPTFAQVKVFGLTVAVKGPQASAVPSPTTDAPIEPLPKAFN